MARGKLLGGNLEERFAIPGAGGLITKIEDGIEFILLQDRSKKGAETEEGLIEIPAGKIREYENIFDCLRREIFEETGYIVEEIIGESESKLIKVNGYEVLSYEPFNSSQNLTGSYPIMVQTFICHVKEDNEQHLESDESKNIRWVAKPEVQKMIQNIQRFYPMHIDTLQKYCKL